MYSKSLFLLASSAFLAFADLSPQDLLAARASDDPDTDHGVAGAAVTATDTTTSSPRLLGEPVAPAQPLGSAAAPLTGMALTVQNAVDRLSDDVRLTSHSEALRYAFRAFYAYRDTYPSQVTKPYLYFVDYGLDSDTPRGYVFDMDRLEVIEGPFNVAHGRGSVLRGADLPTRFLNVDGSNATSLGLYVAQETYDFRGKSGGRAYRSVGLRLKGVSGRFNNLARARGIVVHGAPYVTPSGAGRSEGCPAMEPRLAQRLIPMIANGGLVFHFSPHDTRWMREDPWAGNPVPRMVLID